GGVGMAKGSRRDFDIVRWFELSGACRFGEVAIVEGITFDLNHPDLDRANWQPVDVLGGPPWIGLKPTFIYTWIKLQISKRLREEKGAVELFEGDRVVIRRVDTFNAVAKSLGKLDHPHHRERRLVYLDVLRGDQRLQAPGYWLFAGAGDV